MREIVVVGAGIAGFTAALALKDRGAAVTVVDAIRPGAGATGASAGMLAAQYEQQERGPYFELCVESRERYRSYAARLEQLGGRLLGARWDGMLVANFSVEEHAEGEEVVAWQREAGCAAEVVDVEEACRLQPGVSGEARSYQWYPAEGQIDSQKLAESLADALVATEVRSISGNAVADIRSRGGRVVGVGMSDGRTLDADVVVLAAGAWSGELEGLPRELPVRPVRGQMLRYPAGTVELSRIVAGHEGRYLVPRADASLLAGSTMEEVGFDQSITEDGLDVVRGGAERLLPALAGHRASERWAGLRPLASDSRPIIGPDPDLEGLIYATGYGRDGILIAPVAGSIVADLALSREPEWDWRPYRPDRFSVDRTSRT